ncbi:MAG: hypothetical protein WD768_11470 [Phycisphaeraceae bacterium]
MTDAVLAPSDSAKASAGKASHSDVQRVMRQAWTRWVTLMIIPFILFMTLMVYVTLAPQKNAAVGKAFFILSIAWLGLVVPASFFLRSRTFKAYWTGSVVTPAQYLRGMTTVWMAIEIGGLIALVGCFLSNSLAPNILPAVVAFMLYMPFWPSGEAMTRPLGDEDDPEVFRHPR